MEVLFWRVWDFFVFFLIIPRLSRFAFGCSGRGPTRFVAFCVKTFIGLFFVFYYLFIVFSSLFFQHKDGTGVNHGFLYMGICNHVAYSIQRSKKDLRKLQC